MAWGPSSVKKIDKFHKWSTNIHFPPSRGAEGAEQIFLRAGPGAEGAEQIFLRAGPGFGGCEQHFSTRRSRRQGGRGRQIVKHALATAAAGKLAMKNSAAAVGPALQRE